MATEQVEHLDELPVRTRPDGRYTRAWHGSAYARSRVRAVAQVDIRDD